MLNLDIWQGSEYTYDLHTIISMRIYPKRKINNSFGGVLFTWIL